MFAGLKEFLFGNGQASKSLARSRLHFVLVQDRTGLSPDDMAAFKKEMIQVIERYFQIDEQGFDISYKRESDFTTLMINSPVVTRRQDSPGGKVGAKPQARHKIEKKDKKEPEMVAKTATPG